MCAGRKTTGFVFQFQMAECRFENGQNQDLRWVPFVWNCLDPLAHQSTHLSLSKFFVQPKIDFCEQTNTQHKNGNNSLLHWRLYLFPFYSLFTFSSFFYYIQFVASKNKLNRENWFPSKGGKCSRHKKWNGKERSIYNISLIDFLIVVNFSRNSSHWFSCQSVALTDFCDSIKFLKRFIPHLERIWSH